MPCFGCQTEKPAEQGRQRRRSHSQYSIVAELDFPFETRLRNALHLKLQLQALTALSEQTYGLAVDGKEDQPYEAKDFFAFKEILGTGPMSVVFRAYFKPTGEVYAVKFVPNIKHCKSLVVRELAILQLSDKCRYLAHFHSHFRVGENMYFVMELYEGGTVDELMGSRFLVPPRLGRIYIKEICCALFFLHSLKVVHRDISPQNCLITSRGHLRVSDFNLCRTVDDPNGERMTNCGKAAFRAPEMYLDKPCTCALDWWAVGIMLYRFQSGYYPFRTTKLTQGYQSVTKLKEKYPHWIFTDPRATDFCQKLLQKNPKQRLGYSNERVQIKRSCLAYGKCCRRERMHYNSKIRCLISVATFTGNNHPVTDELAYKNKKISSSDGGQHKKELITSQQELALSPMCRLGELDSILVIIDTR